MAARVSKSRPRDRAQGGAALVHQRPHAALCCKLVSPLEIAPRFGYAAFCRRGIAKKFQRICLSRRLATFFRKGQGSLSPSSCVCKIARSQKSVPLRHEKSAPAECIFGKWHVQLFRLGKNLAGGLEIARREICFSHTRREHRIKLYDLEIKTGSPALLQERQRLRMSALRRPEPSQDMRYIRTGVKMIGRLRSLAGLGGHKFGTLYLPKLDEGIGQKGTKHYTWISGPACPLGVQLRSFKR